MYPRCGCRPRCEPHWAAPSFPGRDHMLRIISFPTTEGFATTPSGCVIQLKPTWGSTGRCRRLTTHYTLIISYVMYRKMESVEYSGAEHRNPGYQTQQLSSISAATEPTLSSYYVWYFTMRWCNLTWQPVCRLSDMVEMYETLTKWGPREELQYEWSLHFGCENKT